MTEFCKSMETVNMDKVPEKYPYVEDILHAIKPL